MVKIIFDASPMLTNKTGVAYYTERLVTSLAEQYPDEVELVGFYYNFLGRRDSSHLPRRKNLRYTNASIVPSKIVYQLRRWGIEFPIETLALQKADFILYPNFLSHPSLFKTPSAPVIHDLTYLDLPAYVSAKLRRDLERFVPKAIARAAFVITVSEFSKRRLHQHYQLPLDTILVTPIPPVPALNISAAERQKRLRKLGITKPFILFVGTVEPRKNIPALIQAYLDLPAKLRDTHQLVVAGGIGWNCDKEVALLNNTRDRGVIHTGYISDEDKETLFGAAALFAHASEYEGFGMPLLEAMSHGRACALSDIPVFREVAGEAAQYFDHTKPRTITRALQTLLTSPKKRATLGKKSSARAAAFTWSTVATSVFTSITANLPAPRKTGSSHQSNAR